MSDVQQQLLRQLAAQLEADRADPARLLVLLELEAHEAFQAEKWQERLLEAGLVPALEAHLQAGPLRDPALTWLLVEHACTRLADFSDAERLLVRLLTRAPDNLAALDLLVALAIEADGCVDVAALGRGLADRALAARYLRAEAAAAEAVLGERPPWLLALLAEADALAATAAGAAP